MPMKINAGIVGVTGYSGQELLRGLLRHPNVRVEWLSSLRLERARPIGEILPAWRGLPLKVEPFRVSDAVRRTDLLFLCLPHAAAMKIAPALLKGSKVRIIDLSADFRLRSPALFRRAYGVRHASPGLLAQAAYGLTEWNRDRIRRARLVANPGCYPTAVLLGLGPLAESGLLEESGVIADAKSGVSGAGRSPKEELLFCEVNEDFRAYKVNAHPHIPEMEQELKRWSGKPARLTFVPHLAPLNRGLYATLYVRFLRGIGKSQLRALYSKRYGNEPFIRLLADGVWPQVKSVAGTNFCEIGLQAGEDNRSAIVLSAIDNLGKGAAGQAIQNMNLLCGFPETAGLIPSADLKETAG